MTRPRCPASERTWSRLLALWLAGGTLASGCMPAPTPEQARQLAGEELSNHCKRKGLRADQFEAAPGFLENDTHVFDYERSQSPQHRIRIYVFRDWTAQIHWFPTDRAAPSAPERRAEDGT